MRNAVAELTRRAAAKRVTVGDYIDELLHEHRHEVEKSKQCYEALPPAKRHRFAELLVLRKAEGLEGLDGLLQACHPTMNNNCRLQRSKRKLVSSSKARWPMQNSMGSGSLPPRKPRSFSIRQSATTQSSIPQLA